MRQSSRLALCIAMVVSCSACGNLYMHSDQREEQAKQLEESWDGVQLDDYFSSWKTRRADYTAAMLHAVEERQRAAEVAMRAALVGTCVAAGDNSLARLIDERQRSYIKQSCKTSACSDEMLHNVRTLADAESKIATDRSDQEVLRLHLRALGVRAPTCAGLNAALGEAKDQDVVDALNALNGQCLQAASAERDAEAVRTWLKTTAASEWTTWSKISEERKRQKEAERTAAESLAAYKSALAAYQQAVDHAAATRETGVHLTEATDKLREALTAIAGNEQAIADAAQLRIARIDAVLAGLGGNRGEGEPTSGKAAALLFNRVVVAASDQAAASLSAPSLTLKRDLDQQQFAQAERLLTFRRAKIALLDQQLRYELNELTGLLNGSSHLATVDPAFSQVRLDDVMAGTLPREPRDSVSTCRETVPFHVPTDVRSAVFAATNNLLRSVGRDHSEVARVEVLLTSLDNERWSAEQEAYLERHITVIDALVGQTAMFGRGGQRYTDYANPVQALLLLFIGKGVN